jgi:hypothetical protein
MTTIVRTKTERNLRFLLIAPLLAIPFLFAGFYVLGGGKANGLQLPDKGPGTGFNMELPPAIFDRKDEQMDKMAYYKKADEDSIRRRQLMQQDPYRRHDPHLAPGMAVRAVADTQADGLLRKLDLFKRRMEQPSEVGLTVRRSPDIYRGEVKSPPELRRRVEDTVRQAVDPELMQLKEMIDKIATLRGVEEGMKSETFSHAGQVRGQEEKPAAVIPPAMALPAIVAQDQELVNGTTIALRLTARAVYNNIQLPAGQLVYGMVTMGGDRMQVNIHSIRCGGVILNTAWQAYDLDGLAGIRIPEGLGRQVARQSAEQSIGTLNLAAYDPSIGGQVTNAGIQAARSFFSRKVKTVRVLVPAGYQLLLRDTKAGASALRVVQEPLPAPPKDSLISELPPILPPAPDSLEPFLHEKVHEGKVSLLLRGIYQRDSLLWLYLVVRNRGVAGHSPGELRCNIRQRKHVRRMAVQEVPVELLYQSQVPSVKNGEEGIVMLGMKPFDLAKDKRVVVQMGGQAGEKMLELDLGHKIWSTIK